MQRYIVKRLLIFKPLIVGISFLVFAIMDLAGGDVTVAMGAEQMSA